MKVLLIAGHGAGDPGAVANGFEEQERTRALVNQISGRIPGAETDIYDMAKNCVTECRAGRVPDFTLYQYVLEIHLNAGANGEAAGSMCYIDQTESGHSVEDAILKHLYAIGYGKAWDGVVVTQRQFPGGLVVQNACRSQGVSHCLLEVCFITSKADMDRLNSMLAQTAQAIADGIAEGFRLKEQSIPNTSLSGSGIATAAARESINVRSRPDVTGDSIGVVYGGQAVEVLEKLSSGWLKIVWPGAAAGYAYTSNVGGRYYRLL